MKNKILWIVITALFVGGLAAAVALYDDYLEKNDGGPVLEELSSDDFWEEFGGKPEENLVNNPDVKADNNTVEPPDDNTDNNTAEPPDDNTDNNTAEPPDDNTDNNTVELPDDRTDDNTVEPPDDKTDDNTVEPPDDKTDDNTVEPPDDNTDNNTVEPPDDNTDNNTVEPPDDNTDNNTVEPTDDNTVEKPENNNEGNSEKIEMSIPDFTVLDYNGNEVNLSDYIGKPIVLNFWATWCYYCKSEMKDFNKAYGQYPDVQFLMVNATDGYNETVDIAKQYVEKNGYSFDVFFDTKQEAVNAYYVSGYPTTYFINANGELVARAVGMLDYDTLLKGIEMITEDH